MGSKENKTLTTVISYLFVAAAAVVACVGTFGFLVLRPSSLFLYHQWGDGMQHYFGWVAFRNSSWQFPLGLFDGATYPDATSIIFTDSLPLLACFFKLISGVLPHDFQYFGIWALGCYVLQGTLALKILRRLSKDPVPSVLGALLFLFVPTVIIRQFAHEALGGQWILLLAWDIFLDVWDSRPDGRLLAKTGLLGFLAAGTHIYFLPMCGMILLGWVCMDAFQSRRLLRPLLTLFVYLFSAVLTVYIFGGFSTVSDIVNEAFDFGNMANLNTLWNPLTYSKFFGGLPLTHQGQDDGSAYLGLGFFVLFFVALLLFLGRKDKKEWFREHAPLLAGLLVVFVLVFFFATYPFVSANDRILFHTKLPGIVDRLMSIFRCCGRAAWVLSYGVMLFVTGSVIRRMEEMGWKKALPLLLFVCLALQVADLSPLLRTKYEKCYPEDIVISYFDGIPEVKERIEDGSVRHVVMDQSVDGIPALFVSCWGIDRGLSVNHFYLARPDDEAYETRLEEALAAPAADTLYIFSLDAEKDFHACGLSEIGRSDAYIVGVGQ
ncbi:MAG: DUF6311 domain-containing protein [Lachnospiraceae bacterium]|nr:DUF6311 domain-containing protein [Lachnospiraceae bacterium]